MPCNYNFYATVGDNGYGMSPNWTDITSNVKHLKNEWHRGFDTEEEAYEWIEDQAAMRRLLKKRGICDLATLRNQKFVLLDIPEPTAPIRVVKPANQSLADLIDELENEEEEVSIVTGGRERNYRAELIKAFDAWLTDCMNKLDSK